jgi:hypothetical protein
MNRPALEDIIIESMTVPRRGDESHLTMAVCVALEKHGLAILSDEGVATIVADILDSQLGALRREVEEALARPSAVIIPFHERSESWEKSEHTSKNDPSLTE